MQSIKIKNIWEKGKIDFSLKKPIIKDFIVFTALSSVTSYSDDFKPINKIDSNQYHYNIDEIRLLKSLLDQDLNTEITSNELSIEDIERNSPISIKGGLYSINESEFTNQDGLISSGDRVKIRIISSGIFGVTTKAYISIGLRKIEFSATTRPRITVPKFNRKPNEINTKKKGEVNLYLTEFDYDKIRIEGADFRINNGYWNKPGTVVIKNNDHLTLKIHKERPEVDKPYANITSSRWSKTIICNDTEC